MIIRLRFTIMSENQIATYPNCCPKNESHKKKYPIQPVSYFFGGIFTILFNWFLVVQPFAWFNAWFNPDFMYYLSIVGVVGVVEGIYLIIRGTISKESIRGHQFLMGILVVVEIIKVFLFAWLLSNPTWLIWTIFTLPYVLFQIIFVLSILGIVGKVGEIFKLPQKVQQSK
jgi:hypothetical protein